LLLLKAQVRATVSEGPDQLGDIAFWQMIDSFSEGELFILFDAHGYTPIRRIVFHQTERVQG